MTLRVSGKNMDVGDALRTKAEGHFDGVVKKYFDGGYTGVFELICPGCGDYPYLDYTAVAPRLQWLRGPRALEAALAAYHEHIGASPRPDGDRAGSLGCPLPGPRCAGYVAGAPLVTTGPVVPPGSVSPVRAGALLRRRSQQVNDRPGAADGTPGSCPRSWC